VKTEINDIEALEQACRDMGLTLEVGGEVRYYSGSTPADYTIKLPGRYDLGFKQQADGSFSYVCDSELLSGNFGRGGEGRALIGENGELLMQRYATAKLKHVLARKGRRVTSVREENGVQYVTAEGF